MDVILSLLLFILPAYFANSVPVLLGGGMPLDLGKKFYDGERVLGNSKTMRGFIAGVSAGIVVAALFAISLRLEFFNSTQNQFIAGAALAFGTMLGDAFGSFIKRRMRIKPGKPFFLDSVLFFIVALVLAYPFTLPAFYTATNIGFLLLLTIIIHPLTNFIANRTGLKKVPW